MKKSEVKKEISDFSYWKQLNYHDGLLYCQLLSIDGKDDWRMMNLYETDWLMTRGVLYNIQRKNYKKIKLMINQRKWYQPNIEWEEWDGNNGYVRDVTRIKWVIPVRNV